MKLKVAYKKVAKNVYRKQKKICTF